MSTLKQVHESEAMITEMTVHAFELRKLGERAPSLYEALDRSIGDLTAMASCAWGCRERDHSFENLIRKVVNLSLAARLAAWSGYYDGYWGLDGLPLLFILCFEMGLKRRAGPCVPFFSKRRQGGAHHEPQEPGFLACLSIVSCAAVRTAAAAATL